MTFPRRCILAFIAFAAPIPGTYADRIVLDGRSHDRVIVVESSRAYYICFPADGRTISLAKSEGRIGEIVIDGDADARYALYAEFKARKSQRKRDTQSNPASSATPAIRMESRSAGGAPSLTTEARAGSPMGIPEIRLKGEPYVRSPEVQAMLDANLNPSTSSQSGNAASIENSGAAGARGGSGGSRRGGGSGGGSGAGYSNVSEIFSTVDDADVGESPSPFGD